MELKNVRLPTLALLLVVGLCVGFGQSRELFEDISYEPKYDSEKTLRELQSLHKPRQVAELLAATRFGTWERIGKYNKTDYLSLLSVEPRDCMEDVIDRRRSLCRNTILVGLKNFCEYCLDQLLQYCANTAPWRLLKTFIEVNEKESVVLNALDTSEKLDQFITAKGDEKQSDESNVVAFCKDMDRKQRMHNVRICSRFNWLIHAKLVSYADVSTVYTYLDSFTNKPTGAIAKMASRCKTIVDRCHNLAPFIHTST